MTKPATESQTLLMPARVWITVTLGMVALLVSLNLLINWRLDIFGILRDPRGRRLSTGRHERKAKYLLNFYYVPENFDALVVGASTSINWRLDELTGYRFYNDSLFAGNGSEELMLVRKALERGHFKVALVGLTPRITDLHELQDGLDQVNPREALGSFYSYLTLLDQSWSRINTHRRVLYPDGSWKLPSQKLVPPDPRAPADVPKIDPTALSDYRAMVEALLAHGTRVIYVISPRYEANGDRTRKIMADYARDLLAAMPPAPLIDLNDPQYAYIQNNPDNYIDEDHLSQSGADLVTSLVNQRMHQILGDR